MSIHAESGPSRGNRVSSLLEKLRDIRRRRAKYRAELKELEERERQEKGNATWPRQAAAQRAIRGTENSENAILEELEVRGGNPNSFTHPPKDKD